MANIRKNEWLADMVIVAAFIREATLFNDVQIKLDVLDMSLINKIGKEVSI